MTAMARRARLEGSPREGPESAQLRPPRTRSGTAAIRRFRPVGLRPTGSASARNRASGHGHPRSCAIRPTGSSLPLDRAPSLLTLIAPWQPTGLSAKAARSPASGPPRPVWSIPPLAKRQAAWSPRPPAIAGSGPMPSASSVPPSALPQPASEARQRPPYPVRSTGSSRK
jgi:hypothetical protein